MPNWTKDQQQVIHLRNKNILVSAAAGSGKTAVLVERIIQKITNQNQPVDIDRLLVVTFTKAAAGEMRKRIGDGLEQRLLQEPENEYLQRQAALLHNAQITTIDSFCQHIIRNYFHVIDLDPVFRVADETELTLLKGEILRDLLEEKYTNADPAFLEFSDLFAPGRSDSAIEKLIFELHNIAMSYPWPQEWLNQAGQLYSCRTMEELEDTEWMKSFLNYLNQMTESYVQYAKNARNLCMDSDGPETYLPAIESDIEQLAGLREAQSYREYAHAISRWNPLRLSSKKTSASKERKDQVKTLRDMYLKNGVNTMKKLYFYQEPEQMLSDIQTMEGPVQELIQVTGEFVCAFDARKREEGIVDFNDMEHFALNILVDREEDGTPCPSETAKELQEHYEEILTDEYQDSNYVQELILTSLSRAPERSPYLFMVGDVKQSIYQFRLARPEIFMEKYNAYARGVENCQKIDLHQNFRSRSMVLESANYIFERIMQKALGGIAYDDEVRLVPGAAFEDCKFQTAGKTEVLVIERQFEEEEEAVEKEVLEAAVIGGRILEMVVGEKPLYILGNNGYRRAEYGDIVILLRSPGNWTEGFIEVLTDMGIPAYTETKTGYFSAIEVETILNYLRIIDNPRQDIPLAVVLRSCLVDITDEELASIAVLPRTLYFIESLELFLKVADPSSEEYRVYRNSIVLDDNAFDALRQKVIHFQKQTEDFRQLSQIASVYEVLQRIYQETGYYDIMSAMPAGEKRAANLDMLLQQAVEYGEKDHHGVFAFVHYIECLQKSNIDFGEVSIQGENANAVRIMSIHKSKGLEFPVVFAAGLGKMFNMQDIRKSTVIDPDYGPGVDYIDLNSRVKEPTLIKRVVANRIKQNILAEEIRILYVALTRAKEQLILSGSVRGVEKKTEKWKQGLEYPALSQLTGVQTYLDWIMPVVLNGSGAEEYFEVKTVCPEETISQEAHRMQRDIEDFLRLKSWNADECFEDEIAEMLARQSAYTYPYQHEQMLPVKVSVSELKHQEQIRAGLSGEEVWDTPPQILNTVLSDVAPDIPRPAFLEEEQEISGAQKGTLYHLAMEHFPYEQISRLKNKEEHLREEFLQKLCKDGFMTAEQAKNLDARKFVLFVGSSIGQRMERAAREGRLQREQPFIIGLPAREIYPENPSQEMVLVQGIIDAYFIEQEELVLVDYKTDSVMPGGEEELVLKYQSQLAHYAQALERLTGRKVKEKIIYSFALNRELVVK